MQQIASMIIKRSFFDKVVFSSKIVCCMEPYIWTEIKIDNESSANLTPLMFDGHFRVANAVKSKIPVLPLWSLLVSTQLLDTAFFLFNLAGITNRWGGLCQEHDLWILHSFFHRGQEAFHSHWVLCRWFLGWKIRGDCGAVAFGYWVLDLIVHRPSFHSPWKLLRPPFLWFRIMGFCFLSILIELLLIAADFFISDTYSSHQILYAREKTL